MGDGGRKGATHALSVALARLLSSIGHCCVVGARLVLGSGFIDPGLAQHQPERWSLLRAALLRAGCTGTAGSCLLWSQVSSPPLQSFAASVLAPLPAGAFPSSAFLKDTSIARDDRGAILVDLVSAS